MQSLGPADGRFEYHNRCIENWGHCKFLLKCFERIGVDNRGLKVDLMISSLISVSAFGSGDRSFSSTSFLLVLLLLTRL